MGQRDQLSVIMGTFCATIGSVLKQFEGRFPVVRRIELRWHDRVFYQIPFGWLMARMT